MPEWSHWRQSLHTLGGRLRRESQPAWTVRHRFVLSADRVHETGGIRGQRLERGDGDTHETAVARAAASLVRDADTGSRQATLAGGGLTGRLHRSLRGSSQPVVELLLPPGDFVATTVTLPGVAPDAVPSALRLQKETLFPGQERELALAVHSGRDPDALSEVALWMQVDRLQQWFDAFAREGLFLVAVLPRSVALAAARGDGWLLDDDPDGSTLLYWENGALRAWHRVEQQDLAEDAFRRQWQQLCEQAGNPAPADFADPRAIERAAGRWPGAYAMQPPGARDLARQLAARRRMVIGAGVVAAVVLVAALPFLVQSVRLTVLESQRAGARADAAEARRAQAVVREFESEWGVLTDFPDQRVDEVLLGLQAVVGSGVLGRVELDEGYLTIEGQSPDPQQLLQDLEAHALFTEVDFASATSNNRFSIDLRLTTVDFPAYYEWYFPERPTR